MANKMKWITPHFGVKFLFDPCALWWGVNIRRSRHGWHELPPEKSPSSRGYLARRTWRWRQLDVLIAPLPFIVVHLQYQRLS
jgi:hypothetical protein